MRGQAFSRDSRLHFDLRQNWGPVAAERKFLASMRKINRDNPTSDLSPPKGGRRRRAW
jgi:hypothetical protein